MSKIGTWLKTTFGTEWIVFYLAVGYLDASIAMLLAMFPLPLLIPLFLRNAVSPRYLARQISMALSLCASIFAVGYGIVEFSPEKQFQRMIINPIPADVTNIETNGSVNAMGSSSLMMTFSLQPRTFEAIRDSNRFSRYEKVDLQKMTARVERCLRHRLKSITLLINHISEIYVFTHSSSAYRCDVLAFDKDQGKALFTSI